MFANLGLNEMFANAGIVAHEIAKSYIGFGDALYRNYKFRQENPMIDRKSAVGYARRYGVTADNFGRVDQNKNELSVLR